MVEDTPQEPVDNEPPKEQPETETPVEVSTLSGLEQVLSVSPAITRFERVHMHPGTRDVSAAQGRYIALLEKQNFGSNNLASGHQQKTRPGWGWLRLVLALVLILTAAVGLIREESDAIPPLSPPGELTAVFAEINTLTPEDMVLLAIDYQPAYTGEMTTAAAGVVKHLLDRGAHVAIVSTIPTGPLQAETLLAYIGIKDTWQTKFPASDSGFSKPGFISGGAAGLAYLVGSPNDVLRIGSGISPDAANAARNSDPLIPVQDINFITLVVVITDDGETARMWIEQVKPFLKNVPFMFVLSAQAEPLVRPYYEASSPQIQGMVVGIPGGTIYEGLYNQKGIAQVSDSAFSLTLWMAGILIIVVGIIGWLAGKWARVGRFFGGVKPDDSV